MRTATIFKVFVASPSDLREEREIVRDTIHRWNVAHSAERCVLFTPVLWEDSVIPDVGAEPQDVVNRQAAEDVDALIAMFWTRVGTPTTRAPGGAAEEVLNAIAQDKPTMIYHSRMSLPSDVDLDQLAGARAFVEEIGRKGIVGTFSGHEELVDALGSHLSKLATQLLEKHGVGDSLPYLRKKRNSKSFYVFKANKERLRVQADMLREFDQRSIATAIKHVGRSSSGNLRILDVGCGDGYVTRTRFGDLHKATVLGIDISTDAIESAQEDNNMEHFEYSLRDVNQLDENLGEFDIVFAAETLQHLEHPEGSMHRLWSMLASPGALIIRGSDDGLKTNYPTDEDLDFLLASTNTIRGSSDRIFLRKVPTFMSRLLPVPTDIVVDFHVDTTVGLNSEERVWFFDSYYAYRQNYAVWNAERPGATQADADLAERLVGIGFEQRERFLREPSLYSVSVQSAAVALKSDRC